MKCLVTKLKEVVQDDSIPKVDDMIVEFKPNVKIGISIGYVNGVSPILKVQDGWLAQGKPSDITTGTEELEIIGGSARDIVVYLNKDKPFVIPKKYDITHLTSMEERELKMPFDAYQLKYSKSIVAVTGSLCSSSELDLSKFNVLARFESSNIINAKWTGVDKSAWVRSKCVTGVNFGEDVDTYLKENADCDHASKWYYATTISVYGNSNYENDPVVQNAIAKLKSAGITSIKINDIEV